MMIMMMKTFSGGGGALQVGFGGRRRSLIPTPPLPKLLVSVDDDKLQAKILP